MTQPSFWSPTTTRELDSTPLSDTERPARIVACINVWNDLDALKQTLPSWFAYVEAVIAVDGAYGAIDQGLSTDGTREYLSKMKRTTLVDGAGLSQCDKRSLYFRHTRAGDMLFIIDADETVLTPQALREVPICDVGWIRVHSNLYKRQYGQPRLIRWQPGLRYQGRHHWIYANHRVLCTHQYGGPGFEHRVSNVTINNQRQLGRSPSRMSAKRENHAVQIADERSQCSMPTAFASDTQIGGREALQIAHIVYRDDGLAPSRLHTAINRTTPHSSLFFKNRPGPFGVPDGLLMSQNSVKMMQAQQQADVLHFHGVMSQAKRIRRTSPTVFHHHGSLLRANAAEYNAQARSINALILLSNLELFSWTTDVEAHFLPNVMPVARYRRLRDRLSVPWDGNSPFRIAHSPSKPERKGTKEFLAACERLNARGIPVEPVMLHDKDHHEVLRIKATCHAAFDSFWLGIQCSGLESAAMGLPVIAGDETVARRYTEQFGAVPYTMAVNGEQLETQLERLVDEPAFYMTEAFRVSTYVTAHHDESAVALRYLDLLDTAFGWRSLTRRSRPMTFLNMKR